LRRVFKPRWLEIFKEAFTAAFAAVAAFAIAAEATAGVEEICAVDPNHSCFELRGDMECNVDAFAPDASGETVNRVVGKLDSFRWCAEGHGGKNWAEDLLLGDDRRGMHVA